MEEETVSEFYYECNCTCGIMKFSQDKEDGIAYISYNIPAFFAYQNGTWNNIKRSAKIIWSILTGKEYRFYEIVIANNKKLNSFKEFVSTMTEVKENASVS